MDSTPLRTHIVTGNTYAHLSLIKRVAERNGCPAVFSKDLHGWLVDAKTAEQVTNPTYAGRRAGRELKATPLPTNSDNPQETR